jgi:hypothetical protein
MPGPLLYNVYDTNPDATVDSHVLGLLSATSPLAYNNVTGTFTIQQSSGTQAGFLTAADWTNFNTKQAALSFPLAATLGGTGQSTVTTGDLLYGSGANVWSKLADVATGNVLLSGGVGTAPAWGQVSLTAAVTGVLPIANGGTNNAGPFTAGSVIFSDGTSLAQDNSKLFWNDTAFSLCVGTVTQVAALTVVAQTAGQAGCSILAANAAAVASALGGAITLLSGIGGSPATGLGGIGGTVTISSGAGGTSTNNSGGNGGAFSFQSGAGGASTRPTGLNNAKGGAFLMAAGAGGAASIGGAGGGGTFTIGSGAGGISNGTGAGGLAGVMAISGGIGGANTGTGNGGGGAGIQLTGGTGGSTPAAAGTPGAGGSVLLTGGSAGASGDNVLGNTGGSVTLVPGAGTGSAPVAGKIVFGNAAAQIVNFVAGSGAAAPSTSVGVAIVNYYGSSATNFLGTPSAWLSIQAGGVTYRLPLYV